MYLLRFESLWYRRHLPFLFSVAVATRTNAVVVFPALCQPGTIVSMSLFLKVLVAPLWSKCLISLKSTSTKNTASNLVLDRTSKCKAVCSSRVQIYLYANIQQHRIVWLPHIVNLLYERVKYLLVHNVFYFIWLNIYL